MGVLLADEIIPTNNNDFILVKSHYIGMDDGRRLDDVIKTQSKSELPSDSNAQINVMYFLGELVELNVGFPDGTNYGDMIYISFESGEIATKVNIITNNYKGLSGFSTKTNSLYELMGMWNGNVWMMVKSEVS